MASLGGRLTSLRGRGGRGRRYGGWVRAEPDGLIRGWVSDEANPAHRAEVEVRIDGRPVGRALADRFDPALAKEGRGDGRYGFVLLVPTAFRDGKPHTVEAAAADTGYRLMSKAAEFRIVPANPIPTLRLIDIGPEGVRGRLRGAAAAPPSLELWAGGRRTRDFQPSWARKGPDLEFRIAWDAPTFNGLPRDAALAAPGMIEGGLAGLKLLDRLRVIARPAPQGLKLNLEGPYRASSPHPLQVTVTRADGDVLGKARLEGRSALLPLPPGVSLEQLELQADLGGEPARAISIRLDAAGAQLVSNAVFRRWEGQAPQGWETGLTPEQVSRGFAGLPEAEARRLGLRGDLVRLQLQPSDEARPLLRQRLENLPGGFERQARASLVCLARASAPATLDVRLTGPDGEALQSVALACDEPGTWRREERSLSLESLSEQGPVDLELRLLAPPLPGLSVEVAVLGLAGEGRFAQPPPARAPENLIEQGDFDYWPYGLSICASGGRREIAEGWFVHNRGSAAPVLARAAPLQQGAALLLSAPEIADYCRLETRLDPAAAAGGRLRLGFQAGAPADGPAAFQSGAPFTVIDRIFVLRRGSAAEDAVVANIARRVPLARGLAEHRFDFDLPESSPGAAGEMFLAFDFARPFALRLEQVRLAPASDEEGATLPPALEDPAIAAQAKTLKGLSAWLSGEIVQPGLRFDAQARETSAPCIRWEWSPPAQDSVEVVVCVHDAAEETLACLGSLVGTTTVPHAVLIVDDASGEDTRRRIAAFIADKPWMRMVSNAENLGYTASANLGVRSAAADWVVLLNSDTVATSRWIEGLLECAAVTGAAFVGPVSNAASYQSVPELKDRRGRWKTNALPPGWTPERMARFIRENAGQGFPPTPLLNGFCTLIRREAFLALGGFNEAAFPQGYGEENDLCVRAAEAGYRLAVADHVYVHHAKSASFGAGRRADLQKQASEALKRLHPDIDFTELGDRIREAQPLVELRAAVRKLYEAEA
ncbi:MAG TPA: glycosyltransferase family 2 protein [Caulobacteraceae bacterium]|jgi:GT2 family glycosyltransferase